MANATGTFEITSGEEDAYHEQEGDPKLTRARGNQRFSGDIEGHGSVEWLMCYSPDGTARFVGLQRIEGSVGGRTGSFVIEAGGDHDGPRAKGTWTVIEGSATREPSGPSGEGSLEGPAPPGSST